MAVIEVRNFKKSFGSKIIHDDISFYVKKGECLGLVGGSGTGKSVLLRSLIGLEKSDSGSIQINDVEVVGFSEYEWLEIRKKVGYAFQGGALFDSMTVFENLSYPLKEHTEKNKEQIKENAQSYAEQIFKILDPDMTDIVYNSEWFQISQ